jgi:phage gp29-like protein
MDLSAISTWLARLWKMRVKIPTNFVYKTFQIPEPTEGDEVLEAPESGEDPDTPAAGVDSSADFAEKKTVKSGPLSGNRSQSKTGRFARLRPSMIESLNE